MNRLNQSAIAYVDGSYFPRLDTAGAGVWLCCCDDSNVVLDHKRIDMKESTVLHSSVYSRDEMDLEIDVPKDGSLGPINALTAEIYAVALSAKLAVHQGYKRLTIFQDCQVSILFVKWILARSHLSWLLFSHETSPFYEATGKMPNMHFDRIPTFQRNENGEPMYHSIAHLLTTYSRLALCIWQCSQFIEIDIRYVQSHHGTSSGNDHADRLARCAAKRAVYPQERYWMHCMNPFYTHPFPSPTNAISESWLGGYQITDSFADKCVRFADYAIIQLLGLPMSQRKQAVTNRPINTTFWQNLSWPARMYLCSLQPTNKTLLSQTI